MKKVSASAVSRFLGERFTRSEYHASGQVRGWGSSSPGFIVRTSGDEVIVDHAVGGWRTGDAEKRMTQESLAAYAEYLSPRYDVEQPEDALYLIVRTKEN